MATVMTSRQHSGGQPPLPARNHPGQSNVPHVKTGRVSNQSTRSLHNTSHEPVPPPLPSRGDQPPIRRKSTDTASVGDSHTRGAGSPRGQGHVTATDYHSKTLPHRKTPKTEDSPPPLPRSLPPKKPPANYEKVQLQQKPAHPPTQRKQSLPNQNSVAASPPIHTPTSRSLRRKEFHQETPPQLPARTPKTPLSPTEPGSADIPARRPMAHVNTEHQDDDFESRFRFHAPNDFPEPETADVTENKSYPSRTAPVKRKARSNNLGPL